MYKSLLKGSYTQQWENCKTRLSSKLVQKCGETKILKVWKGILSILCVSTKTENSQQLQNILTDRWYALLFKQTKNQMLFWKWKVWHQGELVQLGENNKIY